MNTRNKKNRGLTPIHQQNEDSFDFNVGSKPIIKKTRTSAPNVQADISMVQENFVENMVLKAEEANYEYIDDNYHDYQDLGVEYPLEESTHQDQDKTESDNFPTDSKGQRGVQKVLG